MVDHAGERAAARWLCLLFALGLVLIAPACAHAYSVAGGFAAGDYATGFTASADRGPIGLAFDQSDNLYAGDFWDGFIYRLPPGGGIADATTRLNAAPITGGLTGLAFDRYGNLFAGRQQAGDVVAVDTATGAVRGSIASGIPCPTGLAFDPVSADLFVSEAGCGNAVARISHITHAVSVYSGGLPSADGIAFGADGTLYVTSGDRIFAVDGTGTPTPGVATPVANVSQTDGLAVARAAGRAPYLLVNRNDGRISKVDLTTSPPSVTDLLAGGTRGDLATTDSRGCFYAAQTDRVIALVPTSTRCELQPATFGATPAAGLRADWLSGKSRRRGGACARLARLSFRLRQRGRVRLRSAIVYVNGRRTRLVRGRRLFAAITLARLPGTQYIDIRVVARTTKGRRLTTRLRYRNCRVAKKPAKRKPRKRVHRRPHHSARRR